MTITSNRLMEKYLAELGGFENIDFNLTGELKQVPNSEFTDENGCITLYALNKSNPVINNEEDKCWWEYDETNFHPDWFYTDDEMDFLKAAIVCAKILMERLHSHYPDKPFRVYISFYETNDDDPDSMIGSSTVRFHQIRNNIVLLPDLEIFPNEAMMQIDF